MNETHELLLNTQRVIVLADSDPLSRATRATSPNEALGNTAVAETRYGVFQYILDDVRIGQSIQWYGEYLHRELKALLEFVAPGATVIETSAGIGLHALALASAMGERGHLMLYEARPLHRRVLGQNIAANGTQNVTLMRRPIGDQQGERIDDLRLERLDAIKINDGSFPLDVIAGAEESMWRLRPVIMLCDVEHVQAAALLGLIRDFGYRCLERVADLFNPSNFYRREEDVFCGQKATTVLCVPEELDVGMRGEGFREIL
jgi:hypothetical protein